MALKLVLASSSPRREKLLKLMGLKFTIVPSKIDESVYTNLPPRDMVQELARAKASEVGELVEESCVIAADTVVVKGNKILGKPSSHEEAIDMLSGLQGEKHTVLTGLAVLSTENGKILVDYDKTDVYMREMDKQEIISYVNTGEPMDKAGSYAIQGLGGIFVERIKGSYFTVMGLPIHKLSLMLKEFSIDVI
ncbi:Maf family protein [Halothermothrix orenii]|uniref:dTTP/UTP pyrophosphatase n=1 Tax=Halothermothrix orenii (strain H 168 / OCM 544 / DSM 9562) TaxID=373903 RepID=B8CY06_HALOH|nr:Maf family protein [Halothermothrix orenii]ACL70175.1 maf protein [Halothermothrix orenii H 168]